MARSVSFLARLRGSAKGRASSSQQVVIAEDEINWDRGASAKLVEQRQHPLFVRTGLCAILATQRKFVVAAVVGAIAKVKDRPRPLVVESPQQRARGPVERGRAETRCVLMATGTCDRCID